MANTVIALKKSSTPSSVPVNLANGELAINFADGKLFYKNTSGYIAEISGAGGGNSFATVNANSTLIVADSTSDILTIEPGTGIAIVGDAINDKITISATGGSSNIGPAFDKANAANIIASQAFDKANAANVLAYNALPNSTVTLAGSLTATGNVIVLGNNYFGYSNSTLAVKFYSFYNVTANSIDTVFNG